jgi:type IV secretory pathway VirB2 component (pilin)
MLHLLAEFGDGGGGSLADPPSTSVLLPAVSWLQSTVLGTVATVIATIAIASIGFMLLTGRVNLRSGAAAVLGCFVLFGASTIVMGIQLAAGRGDAALPPQTAVAPPPAIAPRQSVAASPPAAYDPYAGASVPQQ